MQFAIEVIEGKLVGCRKVISQPGRILIGRDATCDLPIADPLLSRQHCLVEFTPDQIKVIDLKSRNGTFVNGNRIEEVILQANDKIKIGKHTLHVTVGHEEAVPQGGFIGACTQCGCKISEQDLKTMKAVKHGGNLFCERCLNTGIELETVSRKTAYSGKETRSDIPICGRGETRVGSPVIPTMADFSAPPAASVSNPVAPIVHAKQEVKLPPGTPSRIGNYIILELLGEGGMGFVYKAQHTFLETVVAIKVIKEELAAQPDILKRFLQEAKLGISLDHPNILRIHDAGEAEGFYFISMEFFESKDLMRVVKQRGPLPCLQSLKLAIQMANALNYAHQHGVIHRDVKPSNVLVNKNGLVKLADFGLAKAWQKAGAHQLTASGQMLGTIQYISPEQLENSRNVDPKTDIFSLGASIYYILAGIPPFGEEPLGKVIQNILHNEPPPLRDRVPNVPEEFEAVILKALAKKSTDRFPTMEAFEKALTAISNAV
jgi:serine/threonine-protein kinase